MHFVNAWGILIYLLIFLYIFIYSLFIRNATDAVHITTKIFACSNAILNWNIIVGHYYFINMYLVIGLIFC